MNDPNPAVEIKAAAERLRSLASAISTPDPAHQAFHAEGCDVTQGAYPGLYDVATTQTPELAEFIAAMHPGVGEALALWLDHLAELVESVTRKRPDAATAEAEWIGPGLEVARQILGAES